MDSLICLYLLKIAITSFKQVKTIFHIINKNTTKMKTHFALVFLLIVVAHTAILPSDAVSRQPKPRDDFATLRSKAVLCAKGNCRKGEGPQKFQYSEALKSYVASEYEKLKEKPSKFESLDNLNNAKAKLQKTSPGSDVKRNQQKGDDDIFLQRVQKESSLRTKSFVTPSQDLARSILKTPSDAASFLKNNARLLESSNNEYQEYDEGNTQANWGNKYTYLVRTDQWNQYNIIKVTTSGLTLSSSSIIAFSNNYAIKEILVSNQVLVVIGWVNGGWTLVYRIPLFSNGNVNMAGYSFFFKLGYPLGSREKNNRALIVTEQDIGTIDYNWYTVNGPVVANSLGFGSGTYQNAARAYWNLGMNTNINDYYFEENLFDDWGSFINIGNTENLYTISHAWGPSGTNFMVQVVENCVSTPYGITYSSTQQDGYVANSFNVDQEVPTLRVVSVTWVSIPSTLFYQFSIPSLLAGPAVDVSYNSEYLTSMLFVNNYAYLCYQSAIKVTTGNDAGTDFPQTLRMESLHKYSATQSLVTNYLVGFAYNTVGFYKPVVILFKIGAGNINQVTAFTVTNHEGYFSSNYYWSHQDLLIDFNTKSIVFSLSNVLAPEPTTFGMSYLRVLLSSPGTCLTPNVIGGCLPTPTYGLVYKHWNVSPSPPPNEFITASSEFANRFTIVNGFLYSSSWCQFQARSLTTVFPTNTVSRTDLCIP